MTVKCFPGAEGFGTDTTHARDPAAVTIFVDNLDEDGPAAVPFQGCSFRQALLYDGPAYVIFRVSGVINHAAKALKYKKPFKYVAGHTSPGGVCFSGEEHQVQSHDLLIRHIRIRTGEVDVPQAGYDNRDAINSGAETFPGSGIGSGLTYNVVRDHCSGSWAVDECWTDWFDAHDMTDMYCFIAEGLFHSLHPKGPHSMGKLCGIQANRLSWHHNILANCNQRMPQVAGDLLGNSIIDVTNNLIFNWGEEGFAIEHLGNKINAVNNWFQIGPDFNAPTKSPFRVANSASDFQCYAVGNVLQDGRLTSDPAADNWPLFKLDNGQTPPTVGHQMGVPFAAPPVTTQSAAVARQLVIQGAGATLPARDFVDLRILKQIRQRCPKAGDTFFVDSVRGAGGWPIFDSPPPPADTNSDGIPDAWAISKGFSPSATIMNNDFGDGYSVMEHYLGELAGDVFP